LAGVLTNAIKLRKGKSEWRTRNGEFRSTLSDFPSPFFIPCSEF
jgi:hypothetical protein